jgi:cytochrome P450
MTDTTFSTADAPLPKATVLDTLAVLAGVIIPTVAKGPIIRRPKVVAIAERLDLDRRAVKRLQRMRNRYGPGPLLLRIPIRTQAVVLSPEHVRRVLHESPEPFATATREKKEALAHFEPKGALISHGAKREVRRQLNEDVLDTERPMHRLAERFVTVVNEEAEEILIEAHRNGALDWDVFASGWFRVVRRVVLGDSARDDHELTAMIDSLRSGANWSYFTPKRKDLRKQFFVRLNDHLARAEPGSLAQIMAETPKAEAAAPSHQVPQWLFAFDPAGMTTFRVLALLASHPQHMARARAEIAARTSQGILARELPYLRATVLESLRLWPTTPMVLRETTRKTTWETGSMGANTSILIFAPFFHRDDQRLDYAHRFDPEVWLDPSVRENWPLIPFSDGPGVCPGQNLVLMLTTTMLANLIGNRDVELKKPKRLGPDKPLPGTLNNYGLRFELSPRESLFSADQQQAAGLDD